MNSVSTLRELRLPTWVPFVEVSKSVPAHVTIVPNNLEGGNIITLGTPCFHVRIVVFPDRKIQAPSVKIWSAVQNHFASVTIRSIIYALLLRRGLRLQAPSPHACHPAGLHSCTADSSAWRPLTNNPLAASIVLARPRRIWPRELSHVTVGIEPRTADNFAVLDSPTTRRRTMSPICHIEFRVAPVSQPGVHNSLRLFGWGDCGMDITLRRLLTNQIALRLGTHFRLPTGPLAHWIRADSLAPDLMVAHPIATWIVASCVAFRHMVAVQGCLVVARIPWLGTIHLANGLVAHHLALLVVISRSFRATRLTAGAMASWLAILLADRLCTVPGAMGDAALP
mmetsp:Transcript_56327/g.123390  ORF Transcript_56327/g.123390 Transcript_56327/m.123390 type:complete len:339 (-) Transcript_56327:341-1357(-)